MPLETSSKLQEPALVAVINDNLLLGNVVDDLKPEFFNDPNYQFIYRLVRDYYKEYKKVPDITELTIMANQRYNPAIGNLQDVINTADNLFKQEIKNKAFYQATVEQFIKRSAFESFLISTTDKSMSKSTFTTDSLMEEFANIFNYHVTDIDILQLGDYEKYNTMRDQVYGIDHNSKIILSSIPSLNNSLTYGGYKPLDLITVVAAPGVGKTTFLINEGLAAAQQGFMVLHVYLGDMIEVTASNRYMSCLSGVPIKEFINNKATYENIAKSLEVTYGKDFSNRIHQVAFPPGEVSADKLRVIIEKLQLKYNIHYDLIIVDYADNLLMESDNMYENGGGLYNKLKGIAANNKCVVLTASQPQRTYFGYEVIPFEGIAESAKKLHVVDICLTIGKISRDADIATMHLAKIREGLTGVHLRLKLNLNTSKIYEISQKDYDTIKNQFYSNVPIMPVHPNVKQR